MVEKNKGGRPKAVINVTELEKLASLHCTYEEVAGWFGVTKQTVINRMKSDDDFRNAWERGQSKGKIGLRRIQWRIAEQGNSNMAIFLGRVHLNQRDKPEDDGADREPLPWVD
jgi:hypothetical protein